MPRPLPPENAAKAERQAKYRENLAAKGEPEADRVDTALASVFAAFAFAVDEAQPTPENKRFLKIISQATLDLLRSQGFAKEASVKVLRRRLSPVARAEIEDLARRSRIVARMAAT